MILGDTEYRDVIALKRLGGIKRKSQQQLLITTPNVEGKELDQLKFYDMTMTVLGILYSCSTIFSLLISGRKIYTGYLMSDSYLGMDQQYELCFNITNSAVKAAPPGFFASKNDDYD